MKDSAERDVTVFTEAMPLPPEERAAFLDRACAGDSGLRGRVEALLKAHDRLGGFLEQPPTGGLGERRQVASEQPGDRIGHYKLLQQIGEGGCGVVYMAEQVEPVRRRVALKIIKPGMDTKSVIARFEAERQALALMDHPNIAKVFDAGATASGRPFFVMELVRGIRVTDYCDQRSLTTEERLRLFVQICQALQHAHQKGIIHRDIKPSNILVTESIEGAAVPVVIDFGIAKATTNQRLTDKTLFTAFELLIGTPAYMSPEQAAMTSVDVDTRTDIYSLGVLLYELLTGSTPFDAAPLLKLGLDEVRRAIREQEPPRPSTRLSRLTQADLTTVAMSRRAEAPKLIRAVRGDLDWIVMKALEKDRTRRYETANGLALDIQRYLADETVSARPPSKLYKFRKIVSRNRLLFGAIGVVTLLLLGSLAVVTRSLGRERRARLVADAALAQAEADRNKARTEATKSRQVTQFIEEMLEGVGPSFAMGRDTAMLREILDRTAARVGSEMSEHPEVEAELRGLIGRLYVEIGRYEQAAKMHRPALEINRRLFGSESLQAAASLNDLGQAFWKDRKLAEAEAAHSEALRIRRRLLGPDHAEVAASLNALSGVYRRQKRLAEAEDLARQALELRRKLFTNESLEVADTLHNLCIVLGDLGRREESETTARELLAMRKKLLGNEHPLVAAALADVSWAASAAGRPEAAEPIEVEALEMKRNMLGDEHPEVSRSLTVLSDLMRQQGKYSEAYAVLRIALSIQRKLLGEDHPDFLESLRTVAWSLHREGRWAEAEAVHREGLTLRRKRLPNDDPQVLIELDGLVRSLLEQNQLVEPEKLLREALTPEVVRRPASAQLLVFQVELMGRQGRWTEALEHAPLLLDYTPEEHYRYHTLAGLLGVTRDQSAHRSLCRRILAAFSDTTNPYVAERMVQDCLLLPDSGVDLRLVDRLADRAVSLGASEEAMPFFHAAKAMSHYRLGRYREAVTSGEKCLGHSSAYAQAKACAALAMAQWRLGDKDAAQAMLSRGESYAPTLPLALKQGDIGSGWLAWLFARVTLDEARGLLQAEALPPSAETAPAKPLSVPK